MDDTDKLKMALAAWEIQNKRVSEVKKGDFVIHGPDTLNEVVAVGKRLEPREIFIAFDTGHIQVFQDSEELTVATRRPSQKRKPVTRNGETS